MTTHVGYKKCRGDRIVKLRIDGENNEMRGDVKRKNKKFAKFRCAQALVLDIYDSFTREKFEIAISIHSEGFKYKVGEVVKPNIYNKDINEVCGGGIHYFLSEEAAIYYKNGKIVIKTPTQYKSYYTSGQLMTVCALNELGKICGEYKGYHGGGQLMVECTYKNGIKDGEYKSYYKSGRLEVECTFKNGIKCGEHKHYYENGRLKTKLTYQNGKLTN